MRTIRQKGDTLRRHAILAAFTASLSLLSPADSLAQALNACDLNADGTANKLDVQLATSMTLQQTPCTANITSAGVCDIVVVQRVINAVLTGNCVTGLAHNVTLNWADSTSTVTGYNVYRSSTAGGPYSKITASPVTGTTYTDNLVQAGQTYYYVATAVDGTSAESTYSNQATAVVPSP